MQPWIATTLAELTSAVKLATEHMAATRKLFQAAKVEADVANERFHALTSLLEQFELFANAQAEGGAS